MRHKTTIAAFVPLLAFLLLAAPCFAQDFEYLSDITTGTIPAGASLDQVVFTPEGGERTVAPVSFAGRTYNKGIHAFCQWRAVTSFNYVTNYRYSRFIADAGISDAAVRDDWFEWCCVNDEPDTKATIPFKCICRPPSYGANEDDVFIKVGAGATVQVYGKVNGVWEVIHQSAEFYSWSSQPVRIDVDISNCSEVRIRFNPNHTEQPQAPYRSGSTLVPVNIGDVPWSDHVVLGDPKFIKAEVGVSPALRPAFAGKSTGPLRSSVYGIGNSFRHALSEELVTIRGQRIAINDLAGIMPPMLIIHPGKTIRAK